MHYRKLEDIGDVKNKQVIVRVDWNVPIRGGKVYDTFRIDAAMPTIKYLKEREAAIIVMSHRDLGEEDSMRPVAEYLTEKYFPTVFVPDVDVLALEGKLAGIAPGDVVLTENIRRFRGEETSDPRFGKELSRLGNFYVNEAFSVSHRRHASIVELPKHLPSFAGLRFAEEVETLAKVFNPTHPFLFVLGGAKFETKEPLIKKYLERADTVFVGGALANDYFAFKGLQVGRSRRSETVPDLSGTVDHTRLALPIDVVVKRADGSRATVLCSDVQAEDAMFDAGPQSVQFLREKVNNAKLVVWNGPLGIYEDGFVEGTEEMAKMLASSSATTILGGGDTVAAITTLNLKEHFTFVSTAGGAMLQFLIDETLPGIQALERAAK